MDFENALLIFNSLYADVDGYGLSNQARIQMQIKDKSLTYGEISPEAFNSMLKEVKPRSGEQFYDLGSGTGKAVLLAALLYPFSKCVGIEILETLHNGAIGVLKRFNTEYPGCTQAKIQLLQEDFLHVDLSTADILFMHSTCFDEHIWEALLEKFKELKLGSRVLTVTRTANTPILEHFKTHEYNMAWGRATVHFYRKI